MQTQTDFVPNWLCAQLALCSVSTTRTWSPACDLLTTSRTSKFQASFTAVTEQDRYPRRITNVPWWGLVMFRRGRVGLVPRLGAQAPRFKSKGVSNRTTTRLRVSTLLPAIQTRHIMQPTDRALSPVLPKPRSTMRSLMPRCPTWIRRGGGAYVYCLFQLRCVWSCTLMKRITSMRFFCSKHHALLRFFRFDEELFLWQCN